MQVYNVLNLGAGWQSTRILLGSELGELPAFDAVVFADTQWEPRSVYEHLAWLESFCKRNRITRVTAGDLRADAIEFRANRRSSDGKRFASIPAFTKNVDGTQGRIRRQCTKEYKIEPVEKWIRRVLLGLAKGHRVPTGVLVRQWFGISDDEATRASYPGVYRKKKISVGADLNGEPMMHETTRWFPTPWKENVYPLLNEVWLPTRKIETVQFFPRRQSRDDVGAWLREKFPDRTIPRSACIGCPNRTNAEWKQLSPEEFADAVDFDRRHRNEDQENASRMRKGRVSQLFVHRQMVPLDMVDLDGDGEKHGGGCGTLFDGEGGFCNS